MPEEVIPPAPLPFGFRRVSIEEAIELSNRERSVEWHIEHGNIEMVAELKDCYWRVKSKRD